MKDPKNENDYIEDFKEWQENQYSPGHYTGGKWPVFVRWPSKAYGHLLLVTGILSIFIEILVMASGSIDFYSFFFLIIGILMCSAGLRTIRTFK